MRPFKEEEALLEPLVRVKQPDDSKSFTPDRSGGAGPVWQKVDGKYHGAPPRSDSGTVETAARGKSQPRDRPGVNTTTFRY